MAHQTYSLYTNGSEIIGLHMANMPNRMLLQWCNTCNTVKIIILRQSTPAVATLGLDHLEKLELFQVHLESLSINFRDDWLSYGCVWVSTSSSVTWCDICHTSPNSDRRAFVDWSDFCCRTLNLAHLPRCDRAWHFVKRWSQNLFNTSMTVHPQISVK